MRGRGDYMPAVRKPEFTEEQRSLVQSILQERRMSRVALIRYLIKLPAGMSNGAGSGDEPEAEEQDELQEGLGGEMKELSGDIIDMLCAMTDEEYAETVSGME